MHPVLYYLILINVIAFIVFGTDKYRAIHRRWRIPERTLFLLAAFGGSVGCIFGMIVFRHKIRKKAFVFGIPAILLAQLLAVFLILHSLIPEKLAARAAVREEFETLKNLDADDVDSYISYGDIFPNSRTGDIVSQEISEVFPLFFQHFDYKIQSVSILSEGKRASAKVSLDVLDAQALAKDFEKTYMEKQISSKANPSSVEYSAEDSYLLLASLLKSGSYGTKEIDAEVTLICTDGEWEVERTDELDEQLTGYFAQSASSPDLFTPSEVVEIHFDTLKTFGPEQLRRYFHIEDWLSMSDQSYINDISQALAEQIHTYFEYEITDCKYVSDAEASVSMKITSLDFNKILKNYADEILAYNQTSQALQDGNSGRLKRANELLLECISSNADAASVEVKVTLTNSGTGWKMVHYEDATQAILGNISAASEQIKNTMRSAEQQ